MFMDFNILDVTLMGYYMLMSTTSFESLGMLVGTMMPVMTELWFNSSQLFGMLYTLMYVGAVVVLFVFMLSVLNKKEEYEPQYSSLLMMLLMLFLDDLDYNDSNDCDMNNMNIYDNFNLLNIHNNSDLTTMGSLMFTEYSLVLILIALILLLGMMGMMVMMKSSSSLKKD
ncbi:NADH dehydrogenase subunit 6 (mitochondrion) [Pichia kudriavzevii]|uniref:NADH-ubiquinone oxidoreductase chain 6 n=1 Tax=Pichia kudriavzevii TaxID=4909 RepID=A0A2U9RB35_PICKU|nr:NADH dehydrogenase subunit 6 [Pichia kudriavzevii]